jgi:hypothetical protein
MDCKKFTTKKQINNFKKRVIMTNLENFGVQELNAREIRETEGGGLWQWVVDYINNLLAEECVPCNSHR